MFCDFKPIRTEHVILFYSHKTKKIELSFIIIIIIELKLLNINHVNINI